MDFPLDDERIEQIIFAMEDQQSSYGIDPDTGELEPYAEGTVSENLVPIPEWGPADGFQLMEGFVAGLRNPVVRAQLKDALGSGKGVFRKFKDILRTRPDIERLWFSFKEREMRRVVREWYNEERERAGLEGLPDEPEQSGEEAGELTAGEFSIRPGEQRDLEAVRELGRQALAEEAFEADPGGRAEGGPLAAGSLLRVVEAPDGGLAGFCWAVEEEDPASGRRNLCLVQLAVQPSYRGIGLGGLLLARLISEARDRGYHRVLCALGGGSLPLEAALRRRGFVPRSVLYELDPGTWEG